MKVRAKISKIDKRTLAITEIPYTTTTESIKDSIIKANDKGKIKIKKVDDNTADRVEIVIQVSPDESSDSVTRSPAMCTLIITSASCRRTPGRLSSP